LPIWSKWFMASRRIFCGLLTKTLSNVVGLDIRIICTEIFNHFVIKWEVVNSVVYRIHLPMGHFVYFYCELTIALTETRWMHSLMEAKQRLQRKLLNGFDMYKTGVEWNLRDCTGSCFREKLACSCWFDAEKDSKSAMFPYQLSACERPIVRAVYLPNYFKSRQFYLPKLFFSFSLIDSRGYENYSIIITIHLSLWITTRNNYSFGTTIAKSEMILCSRLRSRDFRSWSGLDLI